MGAVVGGHDKGEDSPEGVRRTEGSVVAAVNKSSRRDGRSFYSGAGSLGSLGGCDIGQRGKGSFLRAAAQCVGGTSRARVTRAPSVTAFRLSGEETIEMAYDSWDTRMDSTGQRKFLVCPSLLFIIVPLF